jgi:hypothetical protein
MTLEDHADFVLDFAKGFYVKGQSTDLILSSTERYGHAHGLGAQIFPRWGELQLNVQDGDSRPHHS